ncbi:MAG: sigma-70 family RNA polymerase sigma factor, partial [Acidimicrobiia bacterium]|nr:sigma-70 family RNA polymerase sigma factor [Acidimicrobiia bacterium]
MADRNVEESAELLDRARQGDEGAFSELVRHHQHEVFTLALRLLGNYELAADAAQETFIRAWRALPRFRGDSALSTWLHRITVNTSWTLGRRAQRHRASTLDEALFMDDSSAPSPES